MKKQVLAITVGEPAGIGPEIAIRAAWLHRAVCQCVLVGDIEFLRSLALHIDPAIQLQRIDQSDQIAGTPLLTETSLLVLHRPLSCAVQPGQCDARNGLAVLATLDAAIEGALQGHMDAIVTAPLQKSTINQAGVAFSGHTEYLAQKTHTDKVVMMLASAGPGPGGSSTSALRPLRVALATTHLPLRDVADALSVSELNQIIHILHTDLQVKFGIARPVILVAGLNPHAGENGYLGREDIDIIAPAINTAQSLQMDVRGPYPADTLFQPKYLAQADCVLAMYHDQGLPVLKYASFGRGVNITLGLPIIRTSVDHGTALDIAAQGLGHADTGSMQEALQAALAMAEARQSAPQQTRTTSP